MFEKFRIREDLKNSNKGTINRNYINFKASCLLKYNKKFI